MSEGSGQGPEQSVPPAGREAPSTPEPESMPDTSDAEIRAGLAAHAVRSENPDMDEAISALLPREDAEKQQELFQDLNSIPTGEELTSENEKAYASTFNKHGVRREQAEIFLDSQNISEDAKQRILNDVSEQSEEEKKEDSAAPEEETAQIRAEADAMMEEAQQSLHDKGADLAAREQQGEDVTQEKVDLAVEESRYEVLKEKWKERGMKAGKATMLILLFTILAYIYALNAAGKAVPKR